jgi:hypothetical protein
MEEFRNGYIIFKEKNRVEETIRDVNLNRRMILKCLLKK